MRKEVTKLSRFFLPGLYFDNSIDIYLESEAQKHGRTFKIMIPVVINYISVRRATQTLTGVSNCLDTLVNFQKEHLCR